MKVHTDTGLELIHGAASALREAISNQDIDDIIVERSSQALGEREDENVVLFTSLFDDGCTHTIVKGFNCNDVSINILKDLRCRAEDLILGIRSREQQENVLSIIIHETEVCNECRFITYSKFIMGEVRMSFLLCIKFDDPSVLLDNKNRLRITATTGYYACLVSVLDQALRQRKKAFHSFSPRLSSFYLSEAHKKSERFAPPWLRDENYSGGVEAISLSLDLRKSTMMMEKASRPECFAKWLGAMVSVLKNVVHRHNGVFDKFTGDGILAHFLVEDCQKALGATEPSAIQSAVCCADEMVEATSQLMEAARTFLRYDSNIFGAGIGIALEKTHWSLDDSRHLIVVGRGVVDACRVSSNANAGEILITANTLTEYVTQGGCDGIDWVRQPFTAKGYPEQDELMIYRLRRSCSLALDRMKWVTDLCDHTLDRAFSAGNQEDQCSKGWKAAKIIHRNRECSETAAGVKSTFSSEESAGKSSCGKCSNIR